MAAAGELFDERGYAGTTITDIAERAGLTRRSYFRYFADKREVLFAGTGAIEALWTQAVADAAEPVTAIDAVAAGLEATAAAFAGRRSPAARRQAIIDANPELQERQRSKLAGLAEATAAALGARGVDPQSAALAAELGATVMRLAFERWVQPSNDRLLPALTRALLADLRAVATASA